MEDWELQAVWPLTRSSNEACVESTHYHLCSGWDIVLRPIDRVYVPLRWVGAMSQVQVVQMVFTLEYLQLPPQTCLPIWMLEDQGLMEARAQTVTRDMCTKTCRISCGGENLKIGQRRSQPCRTLSLIAKSRQYAPGVTNCMP